MNDTKIGCIDCFPEGNEPHTSPGLVPLYDTFPVIIAVGVIIMNSLAIALVVRVRKLRTVTNTILASLAASDLMMGVLGIPLYLSCAATYHASLCVSSAIIVRFISVSTVLHHCLVAVDRHLSVERAMRYPQLVTKRRVTCSVLIIWGVALVVAVVQLSWFPSDVDVTEDMIHRIARITVIYDITCLVLFFGLPLAVMVYAYARLFVVLRGQLRAISRDSLPVCGRNTQSQREWRALLILSSMVAVYVIGYVPYFLLNIQHQIGNEFFTLPEWVEYLFFYYPRLLVSLVNPLLYMFGKQDFRKALVKGRLWRRGPSLRRPSRDANLLTPFTRSTRTRSTELMSLTARLSRTLTPIDFLLHRDSYSPRDTPDDGTRLGPDTIAVQGTR